MRHSIKSLFPFPSSLFLPLFLSLLLPAAAHAAELHTEVDLASSSAWTFKPDGGTGAAKTIPVPFGGWRLNGFPDVTAGTYERRVLIPVLKGDPAQVTVVDFESVNWEAVVSIGPDEAHLNQAAFHLSAWTPFRVDISKYVTPGAQALISVHVRDRSYFKDSENHYTVPAGPEWNDRAGRGILRGINLKVFPSVYIDSLFVHPSTQTRTFSFAAVVRNAGRSRTSVTLTSRTTSASRPQMQHSAVAPPYPIFPNSTIVLEAGETRTVTIGPVKWPLPAALDWWPNIPYKPDYHATLHLLTVTASAGAHQSSTPQSSTVRFGFCTMAQKANRYTINGVPINLRGDSLPEGTIGTDAFARLPGFLPPSGLNAALKSAGWPGAVRDYQRLNYNVIRMHQIPCTRYMMDVCDELGMLVIPETAIRGGGVSPENVSDNPDAFTTHLRELIIRDRNHPSVIKWSLENELPNVPVPFLRKLYDTCMQADGSRPCSIDVFDKCECPNWPNFAVIDHYSQSAGSEDAAGGVDRGDRPKGEGEYVWPNGNRSQGPVWFALETRDMRRHDNSDLRPYTLIDAWPSVIPLLTPTNFPDPHLPPDSLEQGGRSLLNPEAPWNHPILRLIQRSFAPVAAFDIDYDRLNMPTNGKGEWPTRVPTLKGGTTTQRSLEVFNDELRGTDVKLVFLPALRISETDTQALPETTLDLHVPLGGHIPVTVPLAAPPVTRCTTLETIITLYKGGQERYRETLFYVVNPAGAGSATVEFAGADTTTLGDWADSSGNRTYGQQAFLLPKRAGRTLYQDPALFLRRASTIIKGDAQNSELQDDNSDTVEIWEKIENTADSRVPWTGIARTARDPVAFTGRDHRLLFRVDSTDSAPHQISLYLLDYPRSGLSLDIDIYDTQGHRLDSRKVDGALIDAGVYEKYRITGSVYIVLESLSTQDPAVSGLFVDPVK